MKAWIVLLTCLGMIAGLSGCQTSSNGQANMLQTAGTLKTERDMFTALGTPKSCTVLENGNRLYTYFFNSGKGMGFKTKYYGVAFLEMENNRRATDGLAITIDPKGSIVSQKVLSDQTRTLRYQLSPF